nr:DNA mismatch repair protein MSH3 [Seculamonas ecuadoriensis]
MHSANKTGRKREPQPRKPKKKTLDDDELERSEATASNTTASSGQRPRTVLQVISWFISALAELDALRALSVVSSRPGYMRPRFIDSADGEGYLSFTNLRHATVEATMSEPFVPNSVTLKSRSEQHGENEPQVLVITGPNMGGKSCFVRSVAVAIILAQMGCYVPAESATLTVFDGIYTRMGAGDAMLEGRSTFMVELEETSMILQRATKRSLILLDELGRGTSTHDGTSLAYSTLEHILRSLGACTLFVTHYPLITQLRNVYPRRCEAMYMNCLVEDESTGESGVSAPKRVTFLYKLTPGVAPSSYGLNVARLAGIPDSIIDRAGVKAHELEQQVRRSTHEASVHLQQADARKLLRLVHTLQRENSSSDVSIHSTFDALVRMNAGLDRESSATKAPVLAEAMDV